MDWVMFLLGLLFSIYPLYLLVRWILMFLTYSEQEKKPPEANLAGKLHEPPSDLKPYFVDALVNKALTPSGRSITSAILELVRLKYISISYKDEFNTLGDRIREYFLELNETKAKDITKLTELEQRFLAFIFQGVGNKVSFSKVKSYHIKEARETNEFWRYWVDQIPYQMTKIGLIDKESYYLQTILHQDLKVVGTALAGIILFIVYAGLDGRSNEVFLHDVSTAGIILFFTPIIFVSIVMFIFRIVNKYTYRRSIFGNEEYSKWLAFKNWMEDYSVTKNYPIDSLILWEKYLIYGLALGVSKKALSELPIRYDLINELVEAGFGVTNQGEVPSSISGDYTASDIVIDLIEFIAFIPEMFRKEES